MSVCVRYTSAAPKRVWIGAAFVNQGQKLSLIHRKFVLAYSTTSLHVNNSELLSSATFRYRHKSGSRTRHQFPIPFSPVPLSLNISSISKTFTTTSSHPQFSSESETSDIENNIIDLKNVIKQLNKFAPITLAESWDNVGLLVEPTPPHQVNNLFLTNDLTEEVLEEAASKDANMILAYHPPIFSAMKRLTMRTEKERIIVRAVEKRIAIYSPHTSYDAIEGGVNDWLASGLGNGKVDPLQQSYSHCYPTPGGYKLEFLDNEQGLTHTLKSVPGVSDIMLSVNDNMLRMRASMNCTVNGLTRALGIVNQDDEVKNTVQITQLTKPPIPHTGMGRLCTLEESATLGTLLQRVKDHLKLSHVQLAVGKDKSLDSKVATIAVCAGSGSSVLRGTLADLYVTGEMSHHEILAAVAQGTSVILCNHSNTERGFLQVLKGKFSEMFEGKINVIVSEVDADPLNVV